MMKLDRRYPALLAVSVSALMALVPLVLILVGSNGTEPRGICRFVEGSAGLLPLDPNAGGTHSYSCNLNWPQVAVFTVPIAILLVVPVWRILRWISRT